MAISLLTVAAVLLSVFYVVLIANNGPVPGEHPDTAGLYDEGPKPPKTGP